MSKVDFVIAKTHQAWFDNLKMRDCKEVIFWTPSDWKIRENLSGKPWYFIKKGSVPALMGVGKFRSYSTYTVYVAWEKYSTKLGVDSLDEFMKVIGRTNTTVQIGCIELYDVEYWDDSDQLLYSKGNYLQKFKYCEASELGVAGYSSVLDMSDNFKLIKLSKKEQKNVNSVLRLGQVAFKKRLIREYGCCCVTGECQKELLEAAHIQPYMSEKSHHI
jgi:putative restriction endonuclease